MPTTAKQFFYLLFSLIRRDLKARYVQTRLGVLWALLHPFFSLLLYTFVFSSILQVRFEANGNSAHFALYLMCGLFPFLALSENLQQASVCLMEQRALIQKVIFPATILPLIPVSMSILNECIGLLLVMTAAYLYFDFVPSQALLLLPLIVFIRVSLGLACSWWLSIFSVFWPDFRQLLNVILPAWMFMTPIVYPAEMIPQNYLWLEKMNPLYHLVKAYRDVILQGSLPSYELYILLLFIVLLNLLGYYFFQSTIDRAKDFL